MTMKKLKNWNDWCNDKAVFTGCEGFPILLTPNAILAIEATESGCDINMAEGYCVCVKETLEEVLAIIGERVEEGKKKREEEIARQRQEYAEMMAQQKIEKED